MLRNASIVLVCCLGAVTYLFTQSAAHKSDLQRTPLISGSKIYLVPIEDFPTDQAQELADYYRRRFATTVPVLQAARISSTTLNLNRGQVTAEKLVGDIRRSYPDLARDPRAVLIGLTSEDIYLQSQNWRFAFGWRDPDTRTAVVSSARMNLHYVGEPILSASPIVRLRKMVTKDIGILYFGLPQSNNPASVLYGNIMGIEELDQVTEDF